MKTTIKKIVLLLVVSYFLVSMLWSCSAENYACSTYAGHYSNLHANYKTRR